MNELHAEAEKFETWSVLKNQDKEEFFTLTSQADVLNEINGIQSQRVLTTTMMDMTRLKLFLSGMDQLEKTLNALKFEHTSKAMTFIWGSLRFLLKTTNINDRAFDGVLDAYAQLGCKIPPTLSHLELFTQMPESEACLFHIYRDIITYHRIAYKLFSLRSKLWQKLFRSKWKALKHTFTHLIDSLNRHGEFMKAQTLTLQNTQVPLYHAGQLPQPDPVLGVFESSGINMDFIRYRNDLEESRKAFTEQEIKRVEEVKKAVLSWISASPKTESLHERFQSQRKCKEAGRWLFKNNTEVNHWMKDEPAPETLIWLHGSRGYGKTILTSLIIDELKKLSEGKPNTTPWQSKTCYFYCQEQDPENCKYLGVLKGILHQMVADGEELLPLCLEKSDKSGNPILTDVDIAKGLIEAYVEYNPKVYIIIDGLDGCEMVEVRQIVDFFKEQVEKWDMEIKQGRLRVLFMSRYADELAGIMPKDDACVKLKPTDNFGDIRAYVKKRMPEFDEKDMTDSGFNLLPEEKGDIEKVICHRSQDMFLYAYLAIEHLLKLPTKQRLLERIKENLVPKELGEIYQEILKEIKNKLLKLPEGELQWQMAKRLLGWLVCAQRPLKLYEMQSILSYDQENEKVDFDNKMLRKNVHTYLGSLIHVLDGGHIRIIHSTAKDHVVGNEDINAEATRCDLTILCLNYLCLPCFSGEIDEDDRRTKGKLGWFSFQDYACSQWYAHVHTVIMTCKSLFDDERYTSEYERKLDSVLQRFIHKYRDDIKPEIHPDLHNKLPELLNFSRFSFYENLCKLWSHVFLHQNGEYDIRNKVGIHRLDEALHKNRRLLEKEFKPDMISVNQDKIKDYYGPNLFKCKRTLCPFFYVGYDNEKERNTHDNRHERPFRCPVTCNLAPIGFASNKDRDRHVRTYHPDHCEGPTAFEALSRRVGPSRFNCTLCRREFTRKDNLKAHERTHFDDRPYSCSNCSKAFTRVNDCKRHEKIHTRRGA